MQNTNEHEIPAFVIIENPSLLALDGDLACQSVNSPEKPQLGVYSLAVLRPG
jgi:hypothetical protein